MGPEGAARVKEGYTTGVRRLAARSVVALGRTRVTPDALQRWASPLRRRRRRGLLRVPERDPLVLDGRDPVLGGLLLDILDGALARQSGKGTPFGAFLDSTTDRLGEALMLGAIGLVFSRDGNEFALGAALAAMTASFLVSYTRARAEALSLKGDVGMGSRAERVTVIVTGLFLAPGPPALGRVPAERDGLADCRPANRPRSPPAEAVLARAEAALAILLAHECYQKRCPRPDAGRAEGTPGR